MCLLYLNGALIWTFSAYREYPPSTLRRFLVFEKHFSGELAHSLFVRSTGLHCIITGVSPSFSSYGLVGIFRKVEGLVKQGRYHPSDLKHSGLHADSVIFSNPEFHEM